MVVPVGNMSYLCCMFILLSSIQLIIIESDAMAVSENKYTSVGSAANNDDTNHFLEDIKQNLKKNNDDYLEQTNKSPVAVNKATYTKQKRDILNSTLVEINKNDKKKFLRKNRRKHSDDSNLSLFMADSSQTFVSENSKEDEPTNMTNILKYEVHKLADFNSQMSSPQQTHALQTISKLSKTLSPLEISTSPKVEIPKFLSVTLGSVTPVLKYAKPDFRSYTDTLGNITLTQSPNSIRQGRSKSNMFMLKAHLMKQQLEEDLIKAHQNLMSMESSDHVDVNAPLDPNELDMAAAKGHNVNRMRAKSRVCQRNVMMVEGPKYDARGHAYLRQYSPRKPNRDFAKTKIPTFVLPRCCNCCQKSVLGCE